MQLKALYYPYARCFDEATLKRAILLFDAVAFIDPTDSSLRNVLITDVPAVTGSDIRDDKALNETYQHLQEEKIVRTYNPTATIVKHDQLLSGAGRRTSIREQELKEQRGKIIEAIRDPSATRAAESAAGTLRRRLGAEGREPDAGLVSSSC